MIELDILRRVANRLDKQGYESISNRLDALLRRFAENNEYDPEKEERALQRSPQELRREEEGQLLGPHSIPANEEERFLAEHDIKPIKSGKNKSSLLGVGGNGSVYRGICGPSFEDKCEGEVAVKLVELLGSNEGDIWRQILKAAEGMPEELKRHFPMIYDIKDVPVEDGRVTQIIVMEKLEPLNSYLVDLLFGYKSVNDDWDYRSNRIEERFPVERIFRDESIMHSLLKKITNGFRGLNSYEQSLLMKGALSYNPDLELHYKQVGTDFTQYITNIGEAIVQEVNPDDPFNKTPGIDFISALMSETQDAFNDIVESGNFPLHSTTTNLPAHFEEIPETKTLLAALRALQGHDIHWGDLHRKNLMMRPGTGDLVIIDVGLYSAPRN